MSHAGYGNRDGVYNFSGSGNTVNVGNRNVNAVGAGYRPSYANHDFYHGSWNGHYGAGYGGAGYGGAGYGGAGYGSAGYGWGAAAVARPMAWGMGAWGSGASMYNCGYLPYSNPYAGAGGNGGYNYAQPIPVAYNTQGAPGQGAPDAGQVQTADAGRAPDANSADQQLNPAIDAFKQGDYDGALDLVNQAIQKTPTDAVFHEFRALVLFAKQDYKQAAATIHSVLAVGPGWDWTTLTSLYSDLDVYNKQLQSLEAFVENHPQEGASHFLLAYHYLTAGHTDSAATELQQVVKLVPGDKVAADLLKMIAPKPAADQPPEPAIRSASSKPVDAARLVGEWKAARDDGSTFNLALADDSSFDWKYSPKQQKTEEFGGTYSVEGNLLVLQRKDGGSLVGQLTPDGSKKFNFKMIGGAGDDPGLDFAR